MEPIKKEFMKKVGITGQGGFMGTHLYNFLGTKSEKIDRINFQDKYFDNDVESSKFCKIMRRYSSPCCDESTRR